MKLTHQNACATLLKPYRLKLEPCIHVLQKNVREKKNLSDLNTSLKTKQQ